MFNELLISSERDGKFLGRDVGDCVAVCQD